MNNPPASIRVMRSTLSSYIGLCGIPTGMTIASFFPHFDGGISDNLKWAAICLLFTSCFFVWVVSFKIVLTPDSLSSVQLFRRFRKIQFEDILKVGNQYGLEEHPKMDGMSRLAIWSKQNPREPYIVINRKMFGREDLRILDQALSPYSDHKKNKFFS
jgi:hypothetical protein